MSKHLPMKTRKMLFNAIMLPHRPGLLLCGMGKLLQQKLRRLHNYGIRIILQVRTCEVTQQYVESKAQVDNTGAKKALQQLRVLHHCIHGIAPEYLRSLSDGNQGQSTHKLFLKVVQHYGERNWNQLPDAVKITQNHCTLQI